MRSKKFIYVLVIIMGIVVAGVTGYYLFQRQQDRTIKSPSKSANSPQPVKKVASANFYGLNYGHSVGLYWTDLPQNIILFVTVYRSESINGPWQRVGRTRVDPWDEKNYFIDKVDSKSKNYYYNIEIESDTLSGARDRSASRLLETRGPVHVSRVHVSRWISKEDG